MSQLGWSISWPQTIELSSCNLRPPSTYWNLPQCFYKGNHHPFQTLEDLTAKLTEVFGSLKVKLLLNSGEKILRFVIWDVFIYVVVFITTIRTSEWWFFDGVVFEMFWGDAKFEIDTGSVMSDLFQGELAESHDDFEDDGSGLESPADLTFYRTLMDLTVLTGWAASRSKWAGITISTLLSIPKARAKKGNPFGMNGTTRQDPLLGSPLFSGFLFKVWTVSMTVFGIHYFSSTICTHQKDEDLTRTAQREVLVGVHLIFQ